MTEPGIEEVDVPVAAADGRMLAATTFSPPMPRRLVIVASATGVRRRYYAAFARWIAGRGAAVVTFDYRGIGESASQPLSFDSARMHEWGERDLDGVFTWARARWPTLVPALVAHSVGGQVAGLARGCAACDALVFVAAGHGYVGNWPWWFRPYLRVLWHGLLPASTRLRGHFPSGWFRLGEALPPGVARDWAAWCLAPDYLFDRRFGLDTGRYRRVGARLVAWGFSDDLIAPPRAVDALVERYPGTRLDLRHITSHRDLGRGVGHFGFFRSTGLEPLWTRTARDLGL